MSFYGSEVFEKGTQKEFPLVTKLEINSEKEGIYREWVSTLLYTGPLPKEWYLRPVDLKEDQQHFEQMLELGFVLVIVNCVATSMCILVVCLISLRYWASKAEWRRLEILEKDQKHKLAKHEKKERDRIREDAIREEERERDFMFLYMGNQPPPEKKSVMKSNLKTHHGHKDSSERRHGHKKRP